MNILFETSIIASFLGGMLALFAPCCISFMLPAYFAYTFKQKKAIILMTFVYFFGVASILVPIGLGVAYVSQFFKSYHTQFFYAGGILLILLAFLSFSGKKISLPIQKLPLFKKHDVLSIYALGLFSGLASSCCAPVLAGVLTLTALTSTIYQALILSLVYVFGMVFPLFVIAYFWESFNWQDSKWVRGTLFHFRLFGRKLMIHSTNLITGIIFLSIGIYILYLATSNKITSVSPAQTQFIAFMTIFQKKTLFFTRQIPDWVFLLIILSIVIFLVKKAKRK